MSTISIAKKYAVNLSTKTCPLPVKLHRCHPVCRTHLSRLLKPPAPVLQVTRHLGRPSAPCSPRPPLPVMLSRLSRGSYCCSRKSSLISSREVTRLSPVSWLVKVPWAFSLMDERRSHGSFYCRAKYMYCVSSCTKSFVCMYIYIDRCLN